MKNLEKYYLLKKNILEMLYKRGYNVPKEEMLLNYKQFKKNVILSSNYFKKINTYHSFNNSNDKIIGFIKSKDQLSILFLRFKIEFMQFYKIKKCLFVIKKISSSCIKAIQIFNESFIIELFYEYEILLNPVRHFLVPHHQILSMEEKIMLLKNYNIKESQIPKILLSDPIARYFCAKKGEIFKITRFSVNFGVYITYRSVI